MLECVTVSQTAPKWRQVLAIFLSSFVSMCAGLTFGITAVLLPELKRDVDFDYDGSQDSWIASISTLSMIIGGLCVGTFMDRYGRRLGHIIINIPVLLGWGCIAFAKSTTLILIGRFITGISSGAHRPITLVYIGEIADPKYRTIALFVPGLMVQLGVLFSHLVGSFCSWRMSCIICMCPAVISFIGFLFLKESPLWLITKGRIVEGTASFRWFRGTSESAEAELRSALQRQTNDKKTTINDIISNVFSLTFIKPFVIIIIIMVNIQFTGINSMNFYAHEIFDRTLAGRFDPFFMMIGTDCLKVISAIVLCVVTKVIPKKLSYLFNTFALGTFLFILFTYLKVDPPGLFWIPVVCLFFYAIFSGALITVGWTFLPELMPGNIRGFASGLASSISYLLLFTSVKVSPDIMNHFGESTLFGTFGIFAIVCGVLMCFLLPETSGKTLQVIEDSFKENIIEKTAL